MLVDSEGRELVDLAELEPYKHGVKIGGVVYPVLTITYKMNAIEIEWSKDDMETLRRKFRWDFDV